LPDLLRPDFPDCAGAGGCDVSKTRSEPKTPAAEYSEREGFLDSVILVQVFDVSVITLDVITLSEQPHLEHCQNNQILGCSQQVGF